MNPNVLQYKNCWKWGHLTLSCCSHVPRCAKCNGVHITEHDKEKVWYCKKNKNFNWLATKEGESCSYVFKCTNCKEDHQVNSYTCPFWHNCFNRD